MAAIPWPGTLPNTADTWQEQDVSVLLKTETDAGPNKVRRKWTGTVTNISLTSVLTSAQVVILKNFFRIDCMQGSLNFTFPDPVTGEISVYRWDATPSFTNLGSFAFQCSMTWKRIPGDA